MIHYESGDNIRLAMAKIDAMCNADAVPLLMVKNPKAWGIIVHEFADILITEVNLVDGEIIMELETFMHPVDFHDIDCAFEVNK